MEYMESYFEHIEDILGCIERADKDIERAGRALYERLKKGGTLYTFGTGHGHLLALEIFYRAGGLARVAPILDERLMLHLSAADSSLYEREEGYAAKLLAGYPLGENDALIIFSNSGINALPVEMALEAKRRGALTLALTSLKHSRAVPSRCKDGKKLYETADLVLDNFGSEGDACVPCGGGSRICPTSTVAGAVILHSLVAVIAQLSEEDNAGLEFFASNNVPEGDAVNGAIIEKYRGKIKSL